jgi:hypothetical protein
MHFYDILQSTIDNNLSLKSENFQGTIQIQIFAKTFQMYHKKCRQ